MNLHTPVLQLFLFKKNIYEKSFFSARNIFFKVKIYSNGVKLNKNLYLLLQKFTHWQTHWKFTPQYVA